MSAVPVGGSTGLDHESTAAIDEAAAWLATCPAHLRPSPIVPALRQRFDLSPTEACQVIREANLRRARAM